MTERYPDQTLGIIGGGNMAEAIVRGLLSAKLLKPSQIQIADPSEERRQLFESLGIQTHEQAGTWLDQTSAILIAIKPQMIDLVATQLAAVDPKRQMVISILAGVGLTTLDQMVGPQLSGRVIRVMPNTPMLIGQGMSAISFGDQINEPERQFVIDLFAPPSKALEDDGQVENSGDRSGGAGGGQVVLVDESQMDAVTAMSGSGPAYLFYFAEAMVQAGQQMGLAPELACQLTEQTLTGAAMLLQQSPEEAATLRQRVTSPGGTTAAALETMSQLNIDQHIVQALQAAKDRSIALSQM